MTAAMIQREIDVRCLCPRERLQTSGTSENVWTPRKLTTSRRPRRLTTPEHLERPCESSSKMTNSSWSWGHSTSRRGVSSIRPRRRSPAARALRRRALGRRTRARRRGFSTRGGQTTHEREVSAAVYSEKARTLRRCEGATQRGAACKAWAVWGEQFCISHTMPPRHHRGPIRRRRVPRPPLHARYHVCSCAAYPFGHRPGGGRCRWPDPPMSLYALAMSRSR